MKLKKLLAAFIVSATLAAPTISSAAVYRQSVVYDFVPADPVPLEDQGYAVIHDTYLSDGTHVNLWDNGQGDGYWTDDAENKLSFGLFRSRVVVEHNRQFVHGHYVFVQRVGPGYVNGVHQGMYSVEDARKNLSTAVKPKFRKNLTVVTRTFHGQNPGNQPNNTTRNTRVSRGVSQQQSVQRGGQTRSQAIQQRGGVQQMQPVQRGGQTRPQVQYQQQNQPQGNNGGNQNKKHN